MTDGKPTVVIAPKANFPTRSLPLHKWIRVACALEEAGLRTVAIDGHEETVKDFPLFAYGFDWAHVTALLERAEVVAGNDSGIPHLAATIGVPTVSAMGPTDPGVVFGHCLDVVTPVLSQAVSCVGCRYTVERGYRAACHQGCEALQLLPWQTVSDAIFRLAKSPRLARLGRAAAMCP